MVPCIAVVSFASTGPFLYASFNLKSEYSKVALCSAGDRRDNYLVSMSGGILSFTLMSLLNYTLSTYRHSSRSTFPALLKNGRGHPSIRSAWIYGASRHRAYLSRCAAIRGQPPWLYGDA